MAQKRDHRNAQEKADWDKDKITPEEAADLGMSVEDAERQREETERKFGNHLAPPE
jgi:hypothetical protein